MVISIGRLGSGAKAADYYLRRQAGCEADYYLGVGDRRGVWLGDGARALGLRGELDPAGEQALRSLLQGRDAPGGEPVGPVLRLDPAARLPAAPLVQAIRETASSHGVEVTELLGDPRLAAMYAGIARRSGQPGKRGEWATVPAPRAGQLATAAGLDPHHIYRTPDGSDRYATAVAHADERVDVRRAGLDATVSAPKSVSVLYGLGDRAVAAQVREAHSVAVREALSYLQANAGQALRGHQGDAGLADRIGTDGLIVAAFEHRTSRAGDPQLHTHLVVPNLVHGVDGAWSAADTRAVYQHAATASSVYHAVLRGQLTTRLGVGWTTPRRGRAEIAGIPTKLLRLFSTRRRQIEAELARLGRTDPAAAQQACLSTRPAKTNAPDQSLRERWATQTRDAGHDPNQLIAQVTGRHRSPAGPDLPALEAELLGPGGVTRHATTFDRRDLLQALCHTLPTGTPLDHHQLEALADRVLAARDTVPLLSPDQDAGRRYSTAELLTTERRALTIADWLARQPGAPMDPAEVATATTATADQEATGHRLSAEQAALIAQLAEAARLQVIVGPAGTGKTAAHRAWQAARIPVQGAALAAVTARRLEHATGIASTSLARLLADADHPDPLTGRPRGLRPGSVLVLDEAGMVDTRTLCRLFTHAATSRTQLVLVGDPRQLPEIDAGGLFATLARKPGALHLSDNRRQQHPWERDALTALRAGNVEEALDAYTAHHRIHDATDAVSLRADLVADYLHARNTAASPYDVTILAVTRADVALLNTFVRAALAERGDLGHTPLEIPAFNDIDAEPIDLRNGDLVIIGRNDNRLALFNGTRAIVEAVDITTSSLSLHTDDDRRFTATAAWAARHEVSHAYAMTVHKAQGLTVDHALLYGTETLTREAGYVGLSRGRSENHVYATAEQMTAAIECDFDRVNDTPDDEQTAAALARRLGTSRTHRLASRQSGVWRRPQLNEEPTRHRSEGISR